MNLVPAIARKIRAMPTVACLYKSDMRVGQDFGAGIRQQANEGIVLCVQDERGHSNTVNDTGARRAIVIVVGVTEIAVAGDDLVIELANGAHRPNLRWENVVGRK